MRRAARASHKPAIEMVAVVLSGCWFRTRGDWPSMVSGKAEETGVRLRLRAFGQTVEEAWALEYVYVETGPGSITRLAAIADPSPRRDTEVLTSVSRDVYS